MTKLTYLGGIIPFTFGIVAVILLVVGLCFKYPICCCKKEHVPVTNHEKYNYFQRFCYGYNYQYVYRSALEHFIGRKASQIILFLFRLGTFVFFFTMPFIYAYVKFGGNRSMYFTIWNIELISLYFFLATISSVIGMFYDSEFENYEKQQHENEETPNHGFWSESLTKFGYAIQILFQIAGSTAFFVTVINFATLDPAFKFWNVSAHFVTTMCFLAELILNVMIVRWEHVVFTILWALSYLIFIWPMVAEGAATRWPYFFLHTDSASVYPWYIVLFLALIIFFYIFWFVGFCKIRIIQYLEDKSHLLPPRAAKIRQTDDDHHHHRQVVEKNVELQNYDLA
jgi:hypothetical protein